MEKYILEGVFQKFQNDPPKEKKLGKKIKRRRAIQNYYMVDYRVKQ